MASPRDLELNEAGWWSRWADLRWTGESSYVLRSPEFAEYFFNRAVLIDCQGAAEDIPKIEAEFEAAGQRPCFAVMEDCAAIIKEFESRDYVVFDRMSVMQMDRSRFGTATGLTVLKGRDIRPEDWASAYSLSFYGDNSVRSQVSLIAERLMMDSSVTLFAGEKDGVVAAALAAFRTPGLLGVYCVGTLEKYRRLGFAGSLIREAHRLAEAEGRVMALQTILSDDVDDFYKRGGFRRLYVKDLIRRNGSMASRRGRTN